jgi:hypothetical protein
MASFIDPTSSTSTSTSTSTTVPFSSPSTSNSTLSVLNPAKTQYHSSTTSRQTSQATSNCSSFQSQTHSSSSPRDLLALKLSKVKATAALFESRSSSSQQTSPSIEHHYQQQQQQQQPSSINHLIISPLDRTNSLDRPRQMNTSMLLTTTTPPPSSCTQLSSSSYPSLQLSSGHVKQIKNQFLSHHSLAQLERRHSSDRPSHHQPAKVLQHYHPE